MWIKPMRLFPAQCLPQVPHESVCCVYTCRKSVHTERRRTTFRPSNRAYRASTAGHHSDQYRRITVWTQLDDGRDGTTQHHGISDKSVRHDWTLWPRWPWSQQIHSEVCTSRNGRSYCQPQTPRTSYTRYLSSVFTYTSHQIGYVYTN